MANYRPDRVGRQAAAGLGLLGSLLLVSLLPLSGCSRSGYVSGADSEAPAGTDHGASDQGRADGGDLADLGGSGELGPIASCPVATATPLQVAHVTPHSITWRWSLDQLGATISGMALWYGTDALAVAQRRPPAQLWDSSKDPNLGFSYYPGPNEIDSTTLRGLTPGTTYHAQLIASWPDGCGALTAAGQGSSWPDSLKEVKIFADVPPTGVTLVCLTPGSDLDNGANNVLELDPTSSECRQPWVNLHLREMDLDLSAIGAARWPQAFLSFRLLARDGQGRGQPIHYLEASLSSPSATYSYANANYVALGSATSWQLIEIPLAALAGPGGLAPAQEKLLQLVHLRIGAAFTSWAVQLDDIAIRY